MIALTVATDESPSAAHESQTLELLASWAITSSSHQGKTPLVVTPSHVMLQAEFFVALAETIRAKRDVTIQFDWCPASRSRFSVFHPRTRTHSAKIAKALRDAALDSDVSFNRCVIVSRPGEDENHLTIGITTDGQNSPAWCEPLVLGVSSKNAPTESSGGALLR